MEGNGVAGWGGDMKQVILLQRSKCDAMKPQK
jgi:hypothetical protein